MSKETSYTHIDQINLPRRLREGLKKADGLLILGLKCGKWDFPTIPP